MSLFKANSTCYSFVISPGTLLLSVASVVFLCDSSFLPKHTYHSILYLSKQKDLDQIPLSALFYSSASFSTNSLKSLYLPPPILLSPFSTVVTFCPQNSTETPLVKVTFNLPGAKCNAHICLVMWHYLDTCQFHPPWHAFFTWLSDHHSLLVFPFLFGSPPQLLC